MSGIQESAKDSRIKAEMNQLRTVIEIYKASHSGDYTNLMSDPEVSSLIEDITTQSEEPNSSISNNAYCIDSSLSSTQSWCIDSIGYSGIGDCSNYQCIPSSTSGISCYSLSQGGEWIDSGLGFCVMKYEAKEVGGLATSTPTGNPWININQDQARTACQAIGAQLITNAQWTTLARNIETTASNWSNGVVGSGVLARGWAASNSYGDSWTNSVVATSTGPLCLYNTGADACGSTGNHLYKRTHTLSNGQTIWDLSGNVWEWNNDTCSQTNWNNSTWIEWNDDALSDYEKTNAGSLGNYTSANGAGRYYGCTANGNGFIRGGDWDLGDYAGMFTLNLNYAPSDLDTDIGFRCTVIP